MISRRWPSPPGGSETTSVIDAVGPERPTFLELVHQLRAAVHSRSVIVRVPGVLDADLWRQSSAWCVRDVLLTGDEYRAMADGLADTDGPATGSIALSTWIEDHADSLGRRYANEIDRHFRRPRISSR